MLDRSVFEQRLTVEVERAIRYGEALSLALIEVEAAQDAVMDDIAAILRRYARTSDTLTRVGDARFALLMPETDATGAAIMSERLHGAAGRTTLSIGVAELQEGQAPAGLVRDAEQALSWAASRGGNTVWRFSPREGAVEEALAEVGARRPLGWKQRAASVRALAHAIDLKDAATRQHSDRVAELAARLAAVLGWPSERVELLRQTAAIHDVGKVGVPDAILFKPARLTKAEFVVVQRHAELGAEIAADVLSDEQTAWVRGHHERVDGSGYPDGLTGDAIPDGARIIAVADAYDVMVSDRPYTRGRDPAEGLREVQRSAGTQFAPEVVRAMEHERFVRLAIVHSTQRRRRARNAQPPQREPGRLEVRCECWRPDCHERLDVAVEELQAARAHQRRFVMADGHEFPDAERVIARTPRFIVGEKVV